MKHVRVTAGVDGSRAPPLFDRLANATAVDRARVIDWNLVADEAMVLLAVDGDPTPLVDVAPDTPGVERCEVVDPDGQSSGVGTDGASARVCLRVERSAVPIFGCLADALGAGGLIVRTPVVFREGEIHATVVGDPGPLQTAFERRGADIDVRIDEISSTPAASESVDGSLSDRQREALVVARELGYYEHPREATHADVAAELGCSPQTAGEHLRRAEAKLADAALDEVGPRA
ncbi:helix-turn-helix domain-containing protein [Halosimplex litoreum]|uniref:Helix-turn-helix domain-containing protein n=1 Tax=Halosimplex litoreum TaxID=1198301 RepID=A0A7T3KTY6_9EURY|nr:helix-turn-helix domain-containing protein [Halosimplex litoreum]QPV61494.1 helix-turn-helix domain-containing protein [Halosimplex litoreum]